MNISTLAQVVNYINGTLQKMDWICLAVLLQ